MHQCMKCPCRSRTEPPRRLNREPGVEADAVMVGCGPHSTLWLCGLLIH